MGAWGIILGVCALTSRKNMAIGTVRNMNPIREQTSIINPMCISLLSRRARREVALGAALLDHLGDVSLGRVAW